MSRSRDREKRIQEDFERLMKLDPHAERQKLKDRVRCKNLDARARKFTTLSPEFGPNPIPKWTLVPKEPIYPAWTSGTRQMPCKPFESGSNTLPGLEHLLKETSWQ